MKHREELLEALHTGRVMKNSSFSTLNDYEEIAITPVDLIPALQLYLSGALSTDEISSWASWALHSDCFFVAGSDDDAIADYYEPMWNVLQQLSTPFLDGPVDSASVQTHIVNLQSL